MNKRVPVEDRTHYTTEEVAMLTGVSETTLREGIKDRDEFVMMMFPFKVRSTITWSKAAVDRWVAGERAAA